MNGPKSIMRSRNAGLSFILLLLLPATALAGQTGFAFLEVPVGARASSLGGAYASVAEGVEGIYWNPAALERASGVQLLASHCEFFQSLRHEQFALAGRGWGGGLSLSLRAMYSEGIEERDELGNLLGTFGSHDLDLALGYGRRLPGATGAGLALHWVRERIANSSTDALALDVGSEWTPERWSGLRVAAVAQNLGVAPHYTIDGVKGDPVPLPAAVQLGGSYRLGLGNEWSMLGSLESRLTRGRNAVVLGGIEVGSRLGGSARFGLRGNDDTASYSAGAGWNMGRVRVDYAYVPYRLDLGDTHRVSLVAQF